MTAPALDLAHVRRNFPGLSRGWTLFDNAGGSQILQGAVDRMTEFLLEKERPDRWQLMRSRWPPPLPCERAAKPPPR